MQALYEQLEGEYGEGYVKWALDSIVRRPNGEDAYLRRDGKLFEKGEIPAKQKGFRSVVERAQESWKVCAVVEEGESGCLGEILTYDNSDDLTHVLLITYVLN